MACLHQSIGLLAHHQKAITECHAREMIDSNKGGRAMQEQLPRATTCQSFCLLSLHLSFAINGH